MLIGYCDDLVLVSNSERVCISNFREGGLILKLFKDEMDAVNSAVATDGGQGESPLTLENLQGGFLFWALPITFIILIFSIEVIWVDSLGITRSCTFWIKLIAIFRQGSYWRVVNCPFHCIFHNPMRIKIHR